MIALPVTFRFDGFDFKMIERDGDVALFKKHKKGIDAIFYEVVIVQKTGDHTWPNGTTTPAHEYMPKGDHWGALGWSVSDPGKAIEKFKEVIEQQHIKETTT